MGELIPFERIALKRQIETGGLPSRRILKQAIRIGASEPRRRRRAEWLKAWRKRLGLTQHEAARLLGYGHRNEIARIEAGYRNPSWEKVFLAILEEQLREDRR